MFLEGLQNVIHRKGGRKECFIPGNMWKDTIGKSIQRRNLEDEKYFDRELLKKNSYVLGLRTTVYSSKIIYIYIYIYIYNARGTA
jgi:hypothetical protein